MHCGCSGVVGFASSSAPSSRWRSAWTRSQPAPVERSRDFDARRRRHGALGPRHRCPAGRRDARLAGDAAGNAARDRFGTPSDRALELGITPSLIAVSDLELTAPAAPASLPTAAIQSATMMLEPYVLTVHTDDVLPIVWIQATAPDRRRGRAARRRRGARAPSRRLTAADGADAGLADRAGELRRCARRSPGALGLEGCRDLGRCRVIWRRADDRLRRSEDHGAASRDAPGRSAHE